MEPGVLAFPCLVLFVPGERASWLLDNPLLVICFDFGTVTAILAMAHRQKMQWKMGCLVLQMAPKSGQRSGRDLLARGRFGSGEKGRVEGGLAGQ